MKILHPNQEDIKERILQLSGMKVYGKVEIVDNTENYMNIYRGQILKLADREFFIMGDVAEPRFGMQDQPKYWVKRTVDMDTGEIKLIKLVFHEEFTAHIGPIRIPCFRSPEKEGRVLEVTRGDERFMTGTTIMDSAGNPVRVIDWIYGDNIYTRIMNLEIGHEEYFHSMCPDILRNLIGMIDAIQFLHNYGLCHGDIRNDHIYIDSDLGCYRWIDFDLTQNFGDYDLWSLGNVIQFVTGKGKISFHEVKESNKFSEKIKNSLNAADGAAFLKYRIMNLRKVYGYIPEKLNEILMRFALGTKTFYDTATQMKNDLAEVLDRDF